MTLPEGWAEATLGDVVDLHNRKANPATLGNVPFVGLENVEAHTGRLLGCGNASEVKSSVARFEAGDILFGRLRPYLNKVINTSFNGCASAEMIVLSPAEGINGHLVQRWLMSPAFLDYTSSLDKGDRPRVNAGDITSYVLSVPPTAEQHRIVAKLDALTARLARARVEISRIFSLTQNYKKAVLNDAFCSDLTQDWRQQNKIEDNWIRSTIGGIAIIASGQTPKGIEESLSSNGEIPWFKVSSMNEITNLKGLQKSQFRLSKSEAKALGLKIYPVGSIAFPKRGGAIATNKKRRLLTPGALDLNLMVLTATGVNPEFLWWWMQKLDLAALSNGSTVPQINNGDIEPLEISIPSVAEQDEIARRITAAFARAERLEAEAARARALLDRLEAAILAKAFRGELVPQDPDDEPASLLLDRIRARRGDAQRAAAPKPGRTRRAGSRRKA